MNSFTKFHIITYSQKHLIKQSLIEKGVEKEIMIKV